MSERAGLSVAVEAEAALAGRLVGADAPDRLRAWEPVSFALRAAANRAGVAVIDWPVLASGRLELRCYLREQTISRIRHRYGNITERAASR
jgi:RHH-type proline utilization regulon transcriptional repressor/proline dehydrogenase/delta 1-pyrroline-5-carboxylate dehydrogenase